MFGYSSIREEDLTSSSGTAGIVQLTSTDLPGMTTHQLTLERVDSATGYQP